MSKYSNLVGWSSLGALLLVQSCALPGEDGVGTEGELVEQVGSAFDPEAPELAASQLACTANVAADRELVIRDLSIVNDPLRTRWTGSTSNGSDGAWQFGRLMANMAGTLNPSDFVRVWLGKWAVNQTVNGQTVAARTGINTLIRDWPKLSNGKLDLTKAPMRLLAIVNRMDLRNLSVHSAGEGRFVFGVLDRLGNPVDFTIILEYRLEAKDEATLRTWAAEWHKLGSLTMGSTAYKSQLEKVTRAFTAPIPMDPNSLPRPGEPLDHPNASHISQIRTNEIHLISGVGFGEWELRQFELPPTGGHLVERPLTLTPRDAFNGSARLARFINANQAAILAQKHSVPLSFEGAPFLGGANQNRPDFWAAPGINSAQARHLFSLNTCDGCHGDESGTAFLHVRPRVANQMAGLSRFMTGNSFPDPVTGTTRSFNDIERRRQDFVLLLCNPTAAGVARVH